MIFFQENLHLIHEYLYQLSNVPLLENYLPPLVDDIEKKGNTIDIGQDDVDF